MHTKGLLFCLAMAAVVFGCAAVASAEDFSADMVSTGKGGSFKGKIYVSQNKTRMEAAESITISRMDKKVVWILMPKEKMYMEQAFDPSKQMPTSEKVDNEIERKLIGQEKIDGKAADKYLVTYKQGGRKESMYQWMAVDLKMPVKMAAVDNSWTMEYKNIKKGKPADSLFEVPAGYEKFAVPSMKDMFKEMGR